MAALGPLFNVVLGFVVVMAGVSMLVSMLVSIVHRLADRRSRELAEMLALTNYAFRTHHGDYGAAGDEATAAFVKDILSDAALVSARDLQNPAHARGRRPIEFIALKDLLEIIERHAVNGELPRSWHVALPPDKATARALTSWLNKWFGTIEANATDRFRKESARLVAVISAFAVVLLNLDAIQLVSDLFNQGALANALAEHAPGLTLLTDELDADAARKPRADAFGDFIQINAVLNVPELKVGWQRSTFIERYCAWRKTCNLPPSLTKDAPELDGVDFALYAVRWFAGLLAATMLLWLGAPFWADRLRDLLRMRSAVQQKARDAQEPSAGGGPPVAQRPPASP